MAAFEIKLTSNNHQLSSGEGNSKYCESIKSDQNSIKSVSPTTPKKSRQVAAKTLNQKSTESSSDSRLFPVASSFLVCLAPSFLFHIAEPCFIIFLFSQPFFGVRCKNHIKTTCYMFVDSFAARSFCENVFFGSASVAFNYGRE